MERKFKVITLCGSSKFKKEFIEVAEKLSLEGNIVISLGLFGHADNKFDTVITEEVKEMLDAAHRQKIKMSDAIYVINPGGYIGTSTRLEIHYARALNKEIMFLEEPIFTYKGIYGSMSKLLDDVSSGEVCPNGGDIYLIRTAGGSDMYGEYMPQDSFVAYNDNGDVGFYVVDLTDVKINLKDPYPYLGSLDKEKDAFSEISPFQYDIYRSKKEIDDAINNSINKEKINGRN